MLLLICINKPVEDEGKVSAVKHVLTSHLSSKHVTDLFRLIPLLSPKLLYVTIEVITINEMI